MIKAVAEGLHVLIAVHVVERVLEHYNVHVRQQDGRVEEQKFLRVREQLCTGMRRRCVAIKRVARVGDVLPSRGWREKETRCHKCVGVITVDGPDKFQRQAKQNLTLAPLCQTLELTWPDCPT